MTHVSLRWSFRRIVSWVLVVLNLIAITMSLTSASTDVQLAWDSNREPDLAGYRILYGTTSGNYTRTIDVGSVTSHVVSALIANTTYYFVVVAYDQAGNVSQPSNEIVITSSTYNVNGGETGSATGGSSSSTHQIASTPTVTSAMELTVRSTRILRPGVQEIQVTGTEFQRGAVLSLGSGITSSPTIFIDAAHLKATVTVHPAAALGPRTLTVTNPDKGSGGLHAALTIVRRSDIGHQRRLHSGLRRSKHPRPRLSRDTGGMTPGNAPMPGENAVLAFQGTLSIFGESDDLGRHDTCLFAAQTPGARSSMTGRAGGASAGCPGPHSA